MLDYAENVTIFIIVLKPVERSGLYGKYSPFKICYSNKKCFALIQVSLITFTFYKKG
jgi:hypothetical protein